MSQLGDMCRTLDGVGSDVREMAAYLYSQSGAFSAAAGQAAYLSRVAGEDSSAAIRTANAMAAAARATEAAARFLAEAESVAARYTRSVLQGGSAAGVSGGASHEAVNTAPRRPSRLEAAPALRNLGLETVEIGRIDFSDNPILSSKGNDVAWSDYLWAAETFRDRILPGIVLGAKREDFERTDREEGRTGLRRLAGAYELYCGSDPVKLSERSNGTYDVIGGRHRVEAARQVGLDWVPART